MIFLRTGKKNIIDNTKTIVAIPTIIHVVHTSCHPAAERVYFNNFIIINWLNIFLRLNPIHRVCVITDK